MGHLSSGRQHGETVETVPLNFSLLITGLKPGVNEKRCSAF
jgi:hypothetical protein